ncbi:MAG TPA: tRNA pseudouridine(38-40) synthase TruA, partial [Actinobacteria bacterium]|nr:tRNA pseudouridine(38-40) synthase TruA [Actinomycetota bacterium]
MPVYRIDLAYDGTGFRGWARNAGVRSVQGEIEAALARTLGAEVPLSVAGRTDAGVHARHQVASFPAATEIDAAVVLRSLRTMLGPEIAVHDLAAAPEGFDARFSAVRRSYRYFIDEAPSHDPLRSRWVWHRGETLDLAAMNQAAAAFVGPHDFASLCRPADGGTTERTVESAGWERGAVSGQRSAVSQIEGESGVGLLVYSVSAKAFCHQMVRSMVALCVDVGRGRIRAEAVPEILEKRDRNAARGVAPAHGL